MKTFPFLICFLTVLLFETGFGQPVTVLQLADSLFANKNWAAAKMKYADYLKDNASNSMAWKDSVRQYQDVVDDQGKIKSVTYDLTYLQKK